MFRTQFQGASKFAVAEAHFEAARMVQKYVI